MAPTIHQRVHGYITHWRTGPGWVRNGAEIRKLRAAGMRVLKVQGQDDGPIPPELAAEWQAAGLQVWLMLWPQGWPYGSGTWTPAQCAEFVKSEQSRFAAAGATLRGVDLNFERPIRDADNQTTPRGGWSREFVPRFRELLPTMPAHLDTVFGDFAGGIENVYTPGIRMAVQTFWGPQGIWDDPPTQIVQWCSTAQPAIPRAVVKPIFRVTVNDHGVQLDPATAIEDTRRAGTKGVGLYYIDGLPLDEVIDWTQRLIANGCAY